MLRVSTALVALLAPGSLAADCGQEGGAACAFEAEDETAAMRVELLQVRNTEAVELKDKQEEEAAGLLRRKADILAELASIEEALADESVVEEATAKKTYLVNMLSKRCVNDKLELEDCKWKHSRTWTVTEAGLIKSGSKCIQAKGENQLKLAHCKPDKEEQQWTLTSTGYFTMKSHPLQCIDVEGMGSTAAGSKLVTGLCMFLIPTSDQRFELALENDFKPTESPTPAPTLEPTAEPTSEPTSVFEVVKGLIKHKKSGKCLSCHGACDQPRGDLTLDPCDKHSGDQLFVPMHKDGFTMLRSQKSTLCLDVDDRDQTTVQMWQCTETYDSQHFELPKDGYDLIKSKEYNKCITSENKVSAENCDQGGKFLWKFKPIE